jgi:hypothetical protein
MAFGPVPMHNMQAGERMKLQTYLMQEAVAVSDWDEAVRILGRHFGLTMPSEFRLDIMGDRYFVHPVVVEIHHSSMLYRWDAETGFRSYDTQFSTGNIYADIYLRTASN